MSKGLLAAVATTSLVVAGGLAEERPSGGRSSFGDDAARGVSGPARGGGKRAQPKGLPDLYQEAPRGIMVTSTLRRGRPVVRLGFGSAVKNVGTGPLVIVGHRRSRAVRTMTADQIVYLADGSTRRYPAVGRLAYVASRDHAHWHLVPFARYELLRGDDSSRIARDRKTGFCLGDRYRARPRVPGAKPRPAFRTRCGVDARRLLRLHQGISVGYGDVYKRYLEGQFVDITGVAPGRYVLVHRANPRRALRESDYANNASSALLELSREDGGPRVTVLAVCDAAPRCG